MKITFRRHSKEKTDEIFNEILEELKGEMDIEKINKVIASKIGGFQLFSYDLSELFKVSYVYRVTKFYPGLPNRLHNPTSFMQPPTESSKLGRANIEKHPVFYCSLIPQTAIDECDLILGQEYYISRWEFHPSESIKSFMLTYDSEKRGGYFHEGIENALNSITMNLSKEVRELMKYTEMRVTDLFTRKGEEYYNISSAIAHRYLYLLRGFIEETPIITYPSVSKKGNEYNFAIHPDFVGNSEKFELVSVLRCSHKEEGQGPIIHSKGINDSGRIDWKNIKVNFLSADIDLFNIVNPVNKKNTVIESRSTYVLIKGKDYLFIDYLNAVIQTYLKSYIESEMPINLDAIDVFEPINTHEIQDFLICPFQEEVTVKDLGINLDKIIIPIKYQVLFS